MVEYQVTMRKKFRVTRRVLEFLKVMKFEVKILSKAKTRFSANKFLIKSTTHVFVEEYGSKFIRIDKFFETENI